ncbi:MAG: hypothetical protein U9N58_08480, partial [Thermodesulfobacteriota bacterium]|nr:hypothetical protein [Thermodesulfobacteriota bacterium]
GGGGGGGGGAVGVVEGGTVGSVTAETGPGLLGASNVGFEAETMLPVLSGSSKVAPAIAGGAAPTVAGGAAGGGAAEALKYGAVMALAKGGSAMLGAESEAEAKEDMLKQIQAEQEEARKRREAGGFKVNDPARFKVKPKDPFAMDYRQTQLYKPASPPPGLFTKPPTGMLSAP